MKKDNTEIIIRSIFAKNLKKFREDAHMSQMDLADNTDLSHNFINDIEHGKKSPSFQTITKFIKVFKIEPHLFFMQDTKMYIRDSDLFKAELANSIAFAVNETIDRHSLDYPKNEAN